MHPIKKLIASLSLTTAAGLLSFSASAVTASALDDAHLSRTLTTRNIIGGTSASEES